MEEKKKFKLFESVGKFVDEAIDLTIKHLDKNEHKLDREQIKNKLEEM